MRNLQAEMKRNGVTVADIQKILGVSDRTVRNKVNGETDFTYREAKKLRDALFPNYRMEYLYAD